MEFDGYVACVCEGSAETAIIKILLEHELLCFSEDQLFHKQVIRSRSASNFETKYLGKSFQKKITILRILDSKKESFKLSPAYRDKIEVINVITAPEIEMLLIFNEDKYEDFKKSKLKPSEFCIQKLRFKQVKSYDFVKDYFSDVNSLVKAIELYHQKSKIAKDQISLLDILK